MTEDHAPAANDLTTVAVNDRMALEVLAPDVPIPGYWTQNGVPLATAGNHDPDPGVAVFEWMPSPLEGGSPFSTGRVLVPTGSYSGLQPAFNVVFVPAGA